MTVSGGSSGPSARLHTPLHSVSRLHQDTLEPPPSSFTLSFVCLSLIFVSCLLSLFNTSPFPLTSIFPSCSVYLSLVRSGLCNLDLDFTTTTALLSSLLSLPALHLTALFCSVSSRLTPPPTKTGAYPGVLSLVSTPLSLGSDLPALPSFGSSWML